MCILKWMKFMHGYTGVKKQPLNKGKGNSCPCPCHEDIRGGGRGIVLILNLSIFGGDSLHQGGS